MNLSIRNNTGFGININLHLFGPHFRGLIVQVHSPLRVQGSREFVNSGFIRGQPKRTLRDNNRPDGLKNFGHPIKLDPFGRHI
jgi:hypothetical protein